MATSAHLLSVTRNSPANYDLVFDTKITGGLLNSGLTMFGGSNAGESQADDFTINLDWTTDATPGTLWAWDPALSSLTFDGGIPGVNGGGSVL